jgi:hypothetical protein
MFRVGLLFLLLNLTLIIVALIDCLSTDKHQIRNLPKLVWVLLIILFSPIGGIAWFFAGRPEKVSANREAPRPRGAFPPPSRPRPVAPDDDPEFLRQLNADMRRWEEELKRRDDDTNREKPTDDDGSRDA